MAIVLNIPDIARFDQDFILALEFIETRLASLVDEKHLVLEVREIFIIAIRAAATQVIKLFLQPAVFPERLRNDVRGLIVVNGLFDAPHDGSGDDELTAHFFGSPNVMENDEPLALLRNAPPAFAKSFPEFFFFRSERVSITIISSQDRFIEIIDQKTGRKSRHSVMHSHNLFSPTECLMSGEGEAWAEEADVWIKEKAKKL